MRKMTVGLAGAVLALGMGAAVAATPSDTLVIAWALDDVITLDPAQIGEVNTDEFMGNVCDSLLTTAYDDPSKLLPSLAESWTVSPDRMTYTFKIKQGLKHPSGNPVTAEDVAWSMRRIIWLNFGNAASLTQWGFTKENIEKGIRAQDPATLLITFDKPYPESLILPAIFTGRTAFALDKVEILKNAKGDDHGNGWLKTNSACVGPYKLRTWNANDVVILERNDGYWKGQPPLRRVIIRHVPESGAQRLQLEKGDIDQARILNPEDLAAIEANPNTRIVRVPRHQYYYLSFNTSDPDLAKPQVRQAFRYLIDYQGLEKTVMRYEGIGRASLVPLGAFGAISREEGLPYKLDLEKAKQLMTEAGYPNGFKKELIVATTFPFPDIAQHVQANAAKIGIDLQLNQMASAARLTKVRSREYQISSSVWSTGYPDADAMVSRHGYNPDNRLEAKQNMFPSWNAAWQSDWFDEMWLKSRMEPDPAKRIAMYREIQLRHMQESGMVYMFQAVRNIGVNKQLKDFKTHSFKVWYTTATK